MDLKHIKTLKTIIDEGSFSNASYILGCTQSTVTSHVQQLERDLNLKIFERVGRKMVLTEDGKSIMPHLNSITNSIDELMNYHKNTHEMTGKLKIALPETLLIYKMNDVLKQFKEKAPNVELFLKATNCYEVRKQLLNGDVDLGIHYDINRYTDSIITNKIKDFELTLVSSASLDQIQMNFIDDNQIKPFSIVGHNLKSPYRTHLIKYLENKNIAMHKTLELGSIEAAKQGILSNLGVAYLPKFTVEKEIKNGGLIELQHNIEKTKIKAIYAYHKNKHLTKAMNLFIKLLNEKL